MGVSGGLDSSYLLYLASQWGLRVLAIHIDDGYDTDISKSNLKKLIEKTGFDYEVVWPDAEQFNALTLAYMKAGVPNIAVPQDNVLFAFLYKKMKEYKIKAEIGWEPETMFKDGIKLTIKWFFEHEDWMKNVTSGDYQKYYAEMYK